MKMLKTEESLCIIVSSFPHVPARARSPTHLLAVLRKKASEVSLGEHSASVAGRNHRTQGNDESAYLNESCYIGQCWTPYSHHRV